MINNVVLQNNISSRIKLENQIESKVVTSTNKTNSVSTKTQLQQLPAGLKYVLPEQDDIYAHQHHVAFNAFRNYGRDENILASTFNPETDMDIISEYEKIREAANKVLDNPPSNFVQYNGYGVNSNQEVTETEPVQRSFFSASQNVKFEFDASLFKNNGLNHDDMSPVFKTASNSLNAAIAEGYTPVLGDSKPEQSSSLPPAATEAMQRRQVSFNLPNAEEKSATSEQSATNAQAVVNQGTPNTEVKPQDSQETSEQNTQPKAPTEKKANGEELTEEELAEIEDLKARDEEVRVHENAHKTAGGQYAGSPSYTYTTGPDGKRYVTDGEVSIDISEESDPQATIDKMQQVKQAALAPAEPSGQDRRVYSKASQIESNARQELREQQNEEQAKTNAKMQESLANVAKSDANSKDSNVQSAQESASPNSALSNNAQTSVANSTSSLSQIATSTQSATDNSNSASEVSVDKINTPDISTVQPQTFSANEEEVGPDI